MAFLGNWLLPGANEKPDLTPFSESSRVFSESGRSPETNEERAVEIMYTTDPG